MNLNSLKPYINDNKFVEAFGEYLQSKIVKAYEEMERHTDPAMLYREQGKIEMLKRLLKMRDEINGPNSRQGSLF